MSTITMRVPSTDGTGHHPGLLTQGETGKAVRRLQERLVRHGYGVVVDGDFGPATAAAVRGFQADHGLTPTRPDPIR